MQASQLSPLFLDTGTPTHNDLCRVLDLKSTVDKVVQEMHSARGNVLPGKKTSIQKCCTRLQEATTCQECQGVSKDLKAISKSIQEADNSLSAKLQDWSAQLASALSGALTQVDILIARAHAQDRELVLREAAYSIARELNLVVDPTASKYMPKTLRKIFKAVKLSSSPEHLDQLRHLKDILTSNNLSVQELFDIDEFLRQVGGSAAHAQTWAPDLDQDTLKKWASAVSGFPGGKAHEFINVLVALNGQQPLQKFALTKK